MDTIVYLVSGISAAIATVTVQVRIYKVRMAELAHERYVVDVEHGLIASERVVLGRRVAHRELVSSPDDS